MIRIALDAMGTDHAPATEIDGVALALRDLPPEFTLTLVGPPAVIESHLARYPDLDRSRIRLVDAPDVIGMDEKPLETIRRKRKSSIVIGLGLHAKGQADAFVSAGNTGALLAASTVILGLNEGVQRATVASVLPAIDGPVLLLDSGANLDCSAKELVNFARLGSLYMRDMHGRDNPKVGLLNVGEEEEKGTQVLRDAFVALRAQPRLNFIGNIEGRDIAVPHPIHGRIDVVVCDGFVGNVVLKFYESMGTLMGHMLRRYAPLVLASEDMKPVFRFLDYSQSGGAPMLGVRGVPIICHGSSTPVAIKNAIRMAVESVRSGLRLHISAELMLAESTPA